jgi:hypothetical protein
MCVNEWSCTGTKSRIKFVIPIDKLSTDRKWWQFWKKSSKKTAEESLSKLISNYSEDIDWDNEVFLPNMNSKQILNINKK